jgi:hypothetical protein
VFVVYRQRLEFVAAGKIVTLRVYQVTESHPTVKVLAGSDLDRDRLHSLMSYVVL